MKAIKHIASVVNKMQTRMTDSKSEFDYNTQLVNDLTNYLKGITLNELFELYLLLNVNGVSEFRRNFLHNVLDSFKSENYLQVRKVRELFYN